MKEVGTEPILLDCIAEYAFGRGGRTMAEICSGLEESYQRMAVEQDAIGWRRFMEGMISHRMRTIQRLYHLQAGIRISPEKWAKGLILKLLEITHGQWLYRNVQIHDSVSAHMLLFERRRYRGKSKSKWSLDRRVYLKRING